MPEELGPQRLDLDVLWDFADPAGSEGRFDMARGTETDLSPAMQAEIRTQIARAQGLQRRFAEGHTTLDAVEGTSDSRPDRITLERGRLHDSSGDPTSAIPYFTRAWELAQAAGEDALAVDAAHMHAIVVFGEAALPWHERAFALARSSADPKASAWIGSLGNNLGWTLHDLGRTEEALCVFQDALA